MDSSHVLETSQGNQSDALTLKYFGNLPKYLFYEFLSEIVLLEIQSIADTDFTILIILYIIEDENHTIY